jgi:DNA-binding NarL/FixJ family response regulator
MSLDLAMRETAAARDRLTRIYGRVPAVVLFTQREVGGSLRISRALRLAGAVARLHQEAPGPVIVAAVVPGGQALEHWWRRRWEFPAAGDAVTDARFFGKLHADAYEGTGDLTAATVTAVRALDPFLADVERLWRNGVSLGEIASHAGITERQVRVVIEQQMRALGFEMRPRMAYARRSRKRHLY